MKWGLFIKKYGTALLTGVAVGGVIVTAAVARHDALTEKEGLAEIDQESKKELVKFYAKKYWKTALAATLTGGVIIFSHKIDAKRIAAIAAAAAVAEERFKKYRNLVKNELGYEKEEEIYVESCEKRYMWPQIPYKDDVKEEDLVYFYDSFSDRFFKATVERVQQAMYHLNRNFHLRGYVFLSEFYDFLGLPPNDLAKEIGWSDAYLVEEWGVDPWLDFFVAEKTAENGVKYQIIYYDIEPTIKAFKDWM